MEFGLAKIEGLIVHRVGNKSRDEEFVLSRKPMTLTPGIASIIVNDFIKGIIKSGSVCEFYHESRLDLNEIYRFANDIFDDASNFLNCSQDIARHLYSKSMHPNIAGGDFIIFMLDRLVDNGSEKKAIGLFKIDVEDQYISVSENQGAYELEERHGIDPRKIQKAALIIQGVNKVIAIENGHSITRYWMSDFLKIRRATTPKAVGELVAKTIRRTLAEIGEADSKLKYTNDVANFLHSDDLNLADFNEFNETRIGKDKARIAFKEVVDEAGEMEKPDEELSFDVGLARKEFRRYSRRLNVADGVDMIVGADTEVISIRKTRSSGAEEVVLKVKKRDKK